MDVCDLDYTHINDLNTNEKNPFEVEPRSNWKKIGEVYSNFRSQCLIICSICVEDGDKFDHAYTTNDASAFWSHIQVQHTNFQHYNDETSQKEYTTQEHHGRSCGGVNEIENKDDSAESTNPSISVNTYGTISPHERRLESNNDREQLHEDTRYTNETELRLDDVYLPDLDTNESHLSASKKCADQIVDISDDEDVSSTNCFVQHDHPNMDKDNAIELSDDEEFIRSKEDASTFTFKTNNLYKCEMCAELFIDQRNLDEHKKSHEDVVVNDEFPRTGSQPLPEDTAITGSNGDLQKYRCTFCRDQFFTMQQLEEHQTIHISKTYGQEQNAVLPLYCKTCDQYFSSLESLRSHEHNVHKFGIDLDLTKCLHCEKIILKSNLESHIAEDHKQIDYPLTRHMLLSNVMTQPQPQKDKCVSSRPFKCSICGKRTITETSMVTHHQRFHSSSLNPNTASCEVCTKLVLAKNMSLHMTAMHGHGRRIKCPHCRRCYKSRKNCLIHMKLLHSTTEIQPNQVVEDSLSSSSTATQSEYTSGDRTEFSNSHYQMNIDSFSDELDDEEDIISYGEVIPMNITVLDP